MNNQDLLKCFVLSGTLSDHLELMKSNRVWGTQVELYAAATLFMLPILLCLYSKRDSYKWIVYHPVSSSSAITYPLEKEPVTMHYLHHLELINTSGNHFDIIVDKDNGTYPLDVYTFFKK